MALGEGFQPIPTPTSMPTEAQEDNTFTFFNLREQLIFYGSYHNNPINQIIHFIFVPLILWTVAIWLAYTPPLFNYRVLAPTPVLQRDLVMNGSFLLLAGYALYYLTLEPLAGASWAACTALPMWATANAVRKTIPHAWAWALALHILAWVVQVYFGHVVAEKRRPALMDSFFQSLVLAPLFVWFELLFVCGYRPLLRREVILACRDNITQWKKDGGGSGEIKKKTR